MSRRNAAASDSGAAGPSGSGSAGPSRDPNPARDASPSAAASSARAAPSVPHTLPATNAQFATSAQPAPPATQAQLTQQPGHPAQHAPAQHAPAQHAPFAPPGYPLPAITPLSTPRFNIPPLDQEESNYLAWQYQTKLALRIYGLLDAIEVASPDPLLDPDGAAAWARKNDSAWGLIVFGLSGEPLREVFDAISAKDCWNKLRARYEGMGDIKVAQLTQKIFHTQFTEGDPLEPQINNIIEAGRTMARLGLPFVVISSS
jgi:gag-polypeptide of LTR copia-type